MFDKDSILLENLYNSILEAHRAVPNVYGERPILQILKGIKLRYNKLKTINDKINSNSFITIKN